MGGRNHKSAVLSAVCAAAAIVVLVVAGCSGDRSGESAAPAPPEQFASVDEFVDSPAARAKHRKKVVFIGVDATGWDFLDPAIESGALPNFARLKQEGAWATLRSTACYMTPPAWTTMFSGMLPERTGVYTFGTWDPLSHEFLNVIADDVGVPRVWDIATHAGRRVAVVNIPVTYPPTPVNGMMIAGMMTPNDQLKPIALVGINSRYTAAALPDPAIVSHSRIQRAAAGDSLNTFIWLLYDTTDDGRPNYDRVSVTVVPEFPLETPAEDWERNSFEIGGASPWIKIRVRQGRAVVDGWCRLGMNRSGNTYTSDTFVRIEAPYTYPDELAGELEREFGYYLPTKFVNKDMVSYVADDAARQAELFFKRDDWDLFVDVFTQSDNVHHVAGYEPLAVEVYGHLDRTLGAIMDELGDDGVLIVASDHGSDSFELGIDLNQFFAGAGLLQWDADGAIDFDHTLVFHNLWHLYFNHDLLTADALSRRGIEMAQGEPSAAAFARYLTRLGESLQAEDGRPLPVEFSLLPADAAGNPPDMAVRGSYGDYLVIFWNFKSPQNKVIEAPETKIWFHQRDGILLAWGDGIRANHDAGIADIENIAPTILYAMGLPVAENLDGMVIDELFEPRLLARLPRFVVGDYDGVATARATGTEREDLEKKLKSLGYIQH